MSFKTLQSILYVALISPLSLLGIDQPAPLPHPAAPETFSDEVNKAGQSLQQMMPQGYQPSGTKIILILFALVAFLVLAAWALKKVNASRMGLFSSSKGIKIIERKGISPKSILYIVEVEGKKILIAESQVEVRALATFDKQELDTP